MHRRCWSDRLLVATVGAVLVLQARGPIHAAFPGASGKILFSDNASGSLTTVNVGSNPSSIPNTLGYAHASWSPNGQRIVFSIGAIYVMNADGTGQTPLAGAVGYEPSWSPDGTKIVWQRECDIWVMNADGTGQRNLTQTPGNCSPLTAQEFHPKWSPNGAKISFETYRTGNLEIFTMNPDGSGATNLTNSSGADYMADWSPDGTRIVFRSDRDGGATPGEIYVMDANGLNQTNLSRAPFSYEQAPVWSPDGARIAFVSTRGGSYDIYTMNPDGSDVRLVLRTFTTEYIDWQPIASRSDTDGDGVLDEADNCPFDANSNQVNTDGDPQGDACDPDDDNDGFLDGSDKCPLVAGTNEGCPASFNFSGFFPPVDNVPVVNTVRAGRSIPVKFSLSGNQGLAIFAPHSPASQTVACVGGAPTGAAAATGAAGGSALTYDAATDQYTYVWKTDRAWSGTCRRLLVTLSDGSTHEALFRFK